MNRPASVLLLAACLPVHAADILVWTFDKGLDGWSPRNWESVAVQDGAIVGASRYDCQLLSPVLNVQAEDYAALVVRVHSDRQGRGEVFFNAPGERMSDRRKVGHILPSAKGYVLHRVPLQGAAEWRGTIERIRFDPLNPAGAKMQIDLIALVPVGQGLFINGGAEMLAGDVPLEWTRGPDPKRERVTTEQPYRGLRALRMSDAGWWELSQVDLSFLNQLSVSFHYRGGPLRVQARYSDFDGKRVGETTSSTSAATGQWRSGSCTFDPPRRAATVRLRFHAPPGAHTADVDEVRVGYGPRGYIQTPPTAAPTWAAQWIWHPGALNRDHVHVHFRHRFTVPKEPTRSARLQVTADDGYALWLNGRELSRTFGDLDGWRTPEVLDLAPALKVGENVITVDAADVASAQGFIGEGVIVFADGVEQMICTDGSWQASMAPTGPWQAAAVLGGPPCQPWGALPYTPLGVPSRVAVRLAGVPKAAQAPGPLTFSVEATAQGHLRRPVHVRALIEQDGEVVRRYWAPRPLFTRAAARGSRDRVAKWTVTLPHRLQPGPLVLRIEAPGAQIADPQPAAALRVVSQPAARGFPKAEIKAVDGLPRLFINGVETNPTQALFSRPDRLQQQNAKAARVRIWGMGLGDMGLKEGGFDYTDVDATIERYLDVDPDAWLIPNLLFDTRYQRWWIKAHPEARCRLEDGSDKVGGYHGTRAHFPSMSSPVWRETYGDALRRLIRHLEASPYASRIIGFQPCAGITAEWFHWGAQSRDLVDYSPAGQADFRQWLSRKYRTDAALRAAWANPRVAFATATVPSGSDRRSPKHGVFYDPATQRHVLDYHRYQHDVVAEAILGLYRIVKEETGGRALCGTYYGYVMHLPETPGFCQGSGHFSLHRLLASRDVDYAIAPTGYAWREVTGAPASMTAPGSFPINGKLWWDQADLRSHWSHQPGHGRPGGLFGSIQNMRREVARCLAQGNAVQWYDFSHGWTFGDDRLAEEVGRLQQVIETRRTAKDWPRSRYLAVIVDEMQMGTFDPFKPTYGLKLIYGQRERLNRSGVPWRAYLLSDLMARPELLEHRAFLVLNAFRLAQAQQEFLRGRLMADGRTVAFVGPVAYGDEKGFAAAHTSDVLGWSMQATPEPTALLAKLAGDLPRPWAGSAGLEFGASKAYAPVLLPDAPTGRVLGVLKSNGRPAVVYDERPKVKLFWSAAPGLPPEVIRSLAATAGVTAVASSNDAVYAGWGYIGIHARRPGPRRVRPPRPCAMRDLIGGRSWPKGTREVTCDLEAGETAILLCSP